MTQRAIDGPYIYFVTFTVYEREWLFVNDGRAQRLHDIMVNACRMKCFELLAHCILPDHVHLLVRKMSAVPLSQAQVGKPTLYRNGQHPASANEKNTAIRKPTFSKVRESSGYTLSHLMQSIKGNFSRQEHTGTLWQKRSYFSIVEDETYLRNAIQYIIYNYRKTSLDHRFGKVPFVFVDWKKVKTLF